MEITSRTTTKITVNISEEEIRNAIAQWVTDNYNGNPGLDITGENVTIDAEGIDDVRGATIRMEIEHG